MSSWHTRLLHGSPPTPPGVSSHGHSVNNDGRRDVQRQHKTLIDGPVVAPASSSAGISPSRALQHGRSVSHSFLPNVASHGGKARKGEEAIKGGVENLDGLAFSVAPGSLSTNAQKDTNHKTSTQQKDIDPVSGKCATCDSLVRWPRHLNVFRCAVCLMVNDLNQMTLKSSNDHGCLLDSQVECEKTPAARISKPVPRISLTKTKSMIDECIYLHLKERLLDLNSESRARVRLHFSEVSVDPNARWRTAGHEFQNAPSAQTTFAPYSEERFNEVNQTQPSPAMPATVTLSLPVGSENLDCHERQLPAAYSQPSPSRAPPPPPTTSDLHATTEYPFDLMEATEKTRLERLGSIFQPLENYIMSCFVHCDCLNASFLVPRPPTERAASEGNVVSTHSTSKLDVWPDDGPLPGLDAKTLLLGDFAENGLWWTGRGQGEPESTCRAFKKPFEKNLADRVGLKTPRINWGDLNDWYCAVISAGNSWKVILHEIQNGNSLGGFNKTHISIEDQQKIEGDLSDACHRVQRTLLKASENLLRRPGMPIKRPEDCRFLLLLLANPILSSSYSSQASSSSHLRTERSLSQGQQSPSNTVTSALQPNLIFARKSPDTSTKIDAANRHSSIIKRIVGLMSNLPDECHHHLVAWFSRFSESHFRRTVDLIGSFVTYRLLRQHGRKRSNSHDPVDELVPRVLESGASSSAQLHAALGITGTSKPPGKRSDTIVYSEDWQIKAAARVMSLLYTANNSRQFRRQDATQVGSSGMKIGGARSAGHQRAHRHGQILPTSTFYNTLLDYSDLVADFETWESRKGKFAFCQYPMFLSIWAKIHIMNYDARRQMEIKAREAFFNSIMSRKAISQYLVLRVRRECLVEDSLRGVSEVVGTGQEEIKKGLRIEFSDEEGVDAGGLRKEWFLSLVREVFDPDHGLFVYDEDSHYCYFNHNTFETSDQFFLVGVVLGLAIYNSTILDVALPPFAFRKLLASAPNNSGPTVSSLRPSVGYSLDDLAEFRPALARGLGQLLDYDGNVEETFCRDFVAEVERYGQSSLVPLCPNGENRPVTNKNRREFVELYIYYLLDTVVARQYEPFKRGFFTVCGGNALSLFRPEEIELLVRGSDEPLDVATLRAVAVYDGWGKGRQALEEPVIEWFWAAFASADSKDQRKLLSFITSSDRIPAMGTTSLVIKIAYLGDDSDRYPIARTCFNMLGIYRYRSRKVLETRLWRAVFESEGFGLR